MHKSRYSSMNHYISSHPYVQQHHIDTQPLEPKQEHLDMLHGAGVPERLAYHIAQLFVRDPMVIFDNAVELDDKERTDHFENLQSTNWNSMRFKPPPSVDSEIGWRVEFRSLDI